jgi:hypothetical protein
MLLTRQGQWVCSMAACVQLHTAGITGACRLGHRGMHVSQGTACWKLSPSKLLPCVQAHCCFLGCLLYYQFVID